MSIQEGSRLSYLLWKPAYLYILSQIFSRMNYTNILKEKVLVNIKELLTKKFICIAEDFSINGLIDAMEIILDYNIFAY